MRKPTRQISPPTDEDFSGALRRSGYLLEARVEEQLRDFRNDGEMTFFNVIEANHGYASTASGTTRELDVFARSELYLELTSFSLATTVACECINNLNPIVLIGRERDRMSHDLLPLVSVPSMIACGTFEDGKTGFMPVARSLDLSTLHCLQRQFVATQYCTFTTKNDGTVMATFPQEDFHDLQKFGDVFLHLQSAANELKGSGIVRVELVHFFLVVQGRICRADPISGRLEQVKSAVMRRTITTDGMSRDFLITVVEEAELPAALGRLRNDHGVFRAAVEARREDFKIAATARRWP
jgi:hypothetical protein